MSVDWGKLGKTWRIRFVQVTPANLDSEMGELEGVLASGATITEGYYTDTRVQAQLSFIGGGWARQAFIRVIAELPEEGYSEELGTFLATADDASTANGEWTTTLSLESMLYAMDVQAGTEPWVVKAGSTGLAAIESMLNRCHRAYIDAGAKDAWVSSNIVYETGTSYLGRVYDLCDITNNRLNVDGHGRVILTPYTLPKNRAESFTIDLQASDGIAMDGLSRSSDYLTRPTECVVYHREGSGDEETETRGYASDSGRVSYGSRGYIVTKVVELSDMSPNTAWEANSQARTRLDRASSEGIEWQVETEYMPIHAGDVGLLRNTSDPYYPEQQKVMVKDRTLDLEHMKLTLTLKLVGDYDSESEE